MSKGRIEKLVGLIALTLVLAPLGALQAQATTDDDPTAVEGTQEVDETAVEEAEEKSTDPDEIEMLEEAREGMLARFFQSLRFFQRKHKVDDEAIAVMEAEEELVKKQAQVDADTKEVLKIAHTWLGKLTKRQKDLLSQVFRNFYYCNFHGELEKIFLDTRFSNGSLLPLKLHILRFFGFVELSVQR